MKEPKRFKTKPVEIEAMEWTGENVQEMMQFCPKPHQDIYQDTDGNWTMSIKTLEGKMHANIGDFIIKGTEGEFYPCKPKQFHTKYEEAKEEEFTYFVSYDFSSSVAEGSSWSTITLGNLIKNGHQIQDLAEELKRNLEERSGVKNTKLSITNFILLES